MITEEQRAKLTPEQLVIAEKWDAEHTATLALVKLLQAACNNNDETECNRVMALMGDNISDFCEHGRAVWNSCIACDEIEKVLYPDLFDANGDRIEDYEEDGGYHGD